MQSPTVCEPAGSVIPAGSQYGRLERATRDLDAPLGVVDLRTLVIAVAPTYRGEDKTFL